MKKSKLRIACLLIAWFPVLLFSLSDLDRDITELEEKLKTVSDKEKIDLLDNFASKYTEIAPDKSLEYAKQALRLAEKLNDPKGIFKSLNKIGNWHFIYEQYQEAAGYYLKALELEPRVDNKQFIANVLTNIGMVYWRLEDYDTSEKYHTQALEMRKEVGYTKDQMATTLNNLGLVAFGKEEYAKAMDYYREALELYKEANYKRGEAAALTNLANIYAELKDYPTALKSHMSAVAIYKDLGLQWWVANSSLGIGNTYILMGQYEKAKIHLESALEKAKEIKAESLLMQIYKSLSWLHEARGDFKPAVEYFDQFTEIKNSLYNETNNKQVDLMQVKYETQKKENELLLLRKANESQRIVKVFLAIGVILSLGLLVILYSQFRTKKKTNQLLRMGEARYRALFSQAGDAIFLVDGDKIIDCNERALEMFGLTRQETIGQSFVHFSLPGEKDKHHDPESLENRIKETLAGQPQRFYWRYSKKDGTLVDVMVSLAAVTVDNKILIQATLHDISEHKQLEEEQVKSVKLETTSLIAGGIAHDFNNLLAIIMVNLELANKEAGSGHKVKPILSRLEKSAHSAVDLSEKFFTAAKSESHPWEILSIDDILPEAVDLVLENSEARVQCHFEIPGDLWTFTGDSRQIKQVIEHLSQNALEAMSTGGKMEVRAANRQLKEDEVPPLLAGHYIVISVKDNGEGIPEENLAKIFDPYFTTREAYTRKGLGMGLTIARAIIKRHHGTITVSSQPGTGTIFHIYLPASD
jgi:PAS domain S-box-containing protein